MPKAERVTQNLDPSHKFYKTDDFRKKVSAGTKKAFERDPGIKKRIGDGIKLAHIKDPSIVARISQGLKDFHANATDEYKEQMSARQSANNINFWHNPDLKDKQEARIQKMKRTYEEKDNIKNKCAQLLLRGLSIGNIRRIYPELGYNQIRGVRSGLNLEPQQKEKTQAIRREAKLKSIAESQGKDPYTLEQKNSALFARKLCDAKLIKDISNWIELHRFYEENNRRLPKDPLDLLRLEVFVKAISEANKGNQNLLRQYYNEGRTIDPNWFGTSLNTEEQFIRDRLPLNLPKPYNEWSPKAKEIIEDIDKLDLPLEIKEAILFNWLYWAIGEENFDGLVNLIGISPNKADKYIRTMITADVESPEYKYYEQIMNKYTLSDNQLRGFKPFNNKGRKKIKKYAERK